MGPGVDGKDVVTELSDDVVSENVSCPVMLICTPVACVVPACGRDAEKTYVTLKTDCRPPWESEEPMVPVDETKLVGMSEVSVVDVLSPK